MDSALFHWFDVNVVTQHIEGDIPKSCLDPTEQVSLVISKYSTDPWEMNVLPSFRAKMYHAHLSVEYFLKVCKPVFIKATNARTLCQPV